MEFLSEVMKMFWSWPGWWLPLNYALHTSIKLFLKRKSEGEGIMENQGTTVDFEGEESIIQRMGVASGSWEWPVADGKEMNNSVLYPLGTQFCQSDMSGSRFSPQPTGKSPGWCTPYLWPLEILSTVPSWAGQFLHNFEVINGCCLKLLSW